jgi:hypothetical protein
MALPGLNNIFSTDALFTPLSLAVIQMKKKDFIGVDTLFDKMDLFFIVVVFAEGRKKSFFPHFFVFPNLNLKFCIQL